MPRPEDEPTRDQLLAMAYADGELSAEARREFEERMRDEPQLGIEVAGYQSLAALSRQVAPREPMDTEWERLEGDLFHRLCHWAGWGLFVVGGLGLCGWGSFEVLVSDMPVLPKALVATLLAGSLVLFLSTVRARMRTLPYDPYRSIQR